MALIISILIFLILSALFSGTEIAFISASKLRIELKKNKGSTQGKILAGFYDKPADFLGTMLVGNNIALVVFTFLMTKLLTPYLETFIQSELLLLFLATIIITLVVLLFGEFLPKTLFRLYSTEVLYGLAFPLRGLQFILALPSWFMTRLSNLLLKYILKSPQEKMERAFTRLDLENFIKDTQIELKEDIDTDLFEKALHLKDVKVRDGMVPRPEIESIDVSASIDELEQLFNETKLSRIIVFKDDIDNVLGYVHHQQLLHKPKSIKQITMDIPFVPEVMRVRELMSRLIKGHMNIACVVDEFGGVAGIITLEDILEEIFGEIEDEYDQEDFVELQISDSEYLFSGRLEIDYLNEKYEKLNLPEGEYQTLSGYLVMTTATIPKKDVEIYLGNFKFILESVSDTKIETIRIILNSIKEDDE